MHEKLKKILTNDHILIIGSGICITILVAALFLTQPSFIRFLDHKLYDQFLKSYHTEAATDVPVIIDLDEKSLANFGQWPWPRYRVAMLLKLLQAYGASSVATDIIFVEPDKTSPEILKKQLKKELKVDIQFKGLPASLGDNDKLLAQNLKTGPFVLGMDFLTHSIKREDEAVSTPSSCLIQPVQVTVLSSSGSLSPHEVLFKAEDAICPLPILASNAPSTGFITIGADEDSLYRRVPLLFSWNERYYPSLALAALMQATGHGNIILKMHSIGVESVRIGKTVIPTDPQGRMLINYRGPSRTFKYISASDILNKTLPKDALKGKIAFIGTSAAGLKDIRPMPLDPSFPGVEAHATIIDNILSKEFLQKPGWTLSAELFLLVAAGLITTALLIWTKAKWILVPLIIMAGGMWYGAGCVYTEFRIYLSPLYSFITLGLTFSLLTMIKFWREEHAKKFIHGAFAHYLAPSVITQIMDDPQSLSLEGQEKNITIQFSDVRDFTSLSEKLTPTQVTDLLHDYLTPMTRIITHHEGTLDKFIGDAVMAFWNAPLDIDNHQDKALKAGLEQLERLEELNSVFLEKFGFAISVGIGIHSGPVRVGNMGSADLFDYTLIGDNVNLASRLEGLTKFYGQKLIVSQAIVEACKGKYYFRTLDRVRVKGKEEPVTIFTVYTNEEAALRKSELEDYSSAHECYIKGDFNQAEMMFNALLSNETEPTLYKLYRDRCIELKNSPPVQWDGVYTHKTK